MSRQVGPEDDCNWTYPGSNRNVPTIMVLRPTWEEFKDFNQYLKKIESMGANKGGVAKIIPPKEWVPRKEKFDIEKCDLKINDPIEQVVNGNRGIYNCINVHKKAISVKEFYKKATSPKYKTPQMTDLEDVERKYWKNLTFVAPIYGADVPGSITDKDCKVWNIQKLGSILDWINDDYNVKIAGVNTAYLYFGMWKSAFAWHTEDMDLHSINYLHHGESKFWYSIPSEYARRFERMALGLFPQFAKDCPSYLRHKMCMISPSVLRQNSIPYNKIAQKEGEIMITFPLGYHSGFNTGFNVAESTNFATERWVEYGKRATRCHCRPDTVNISMDCFVKRLQPDRYENWLNGKDYGRHPEEPNAKLNPAPPPSAEEFMVNNKNKDKEIPLCLLEPKTNKKRRHPIHKTKNAVTNGTAMAVQGAVEGESDCLNIDEDEPIAKVARNQSSFTTNSKTKQPLNSTNINKTNSCKNITQSPELRNSFQTIVQGNDEYKRQMISQSKRNMKEKINFGQQNEKPKPVNNTLSMGTDGQPTGNLVDTISRLQRSLSNNSLPERQSQTPNTLVANTSNPIRNISHNFLTVPYTMTNAATSNMQLNYPHPARLLDSSVNHGKDISTTMQSVTSQYQTNTNPNIPFAPQQLTPPSVGNMGAILSSKPGLIHSTIHPSTTLQALRQSFQTNGSTLKDFMGSLNPIQPSFLNQVSNTKDSNLGSLSIQTHVKPNTISYNHSVASNYSEATHRNIPSMNSITGNHKLQQTVVNQNINILRSLGANQMSQQYNKETLHENYRVSGVELTQNYSPDWARSNQLILTSKDRRQIKTSVTILERQRNGSPWQPPMKLPTGNAWGWQVNGFVNMYESAIYINLHGPRNMARSFMLPFKNILSTTKKSQVAINARQEIWPPCDDMLALCEDVSRWELHMCINPNTDIKATIIDPWKKTYLLTIPGKLLA